MIAIKFGGSVIQSRFDSINPNFYKFVNFISSLNNKFLIVNGGGILCRMFQNSLRDYGIQDNKILDQIGINVNNMLATFVKFTLPQELTYPKLILSKKECQKAISNIQKYNFFVIGSKGVGHSSDYDIVKYSKYFNITEIIKLTSIDYVYDKDPKKYSNVKKLINVTWDNYLNIIGDTFVSGGNYPFDPIASKLAKKYKIKLKLTKLETFVNLKEIDINKIPGTLIA